MAQEKVERAGGIVGLTAGLLQSVVALAISVADAMAGTVSQVGRITSDIGGLFGMDLGGGLQGPSSFSFVWGLIFAYATVIVSALLISGVRARVCGAALVACAILGAFGGTGFALLAILSFAGGIIALIGSFGPGGAASGLTGVMATAQRMAKAAMEAEAGAPKQDAAKAGETEATDDAAAKDVPDGQDRQDRRE